MSNLGKQEETYEVVPIWLPDALEQPEQAPEKVEPELVPMRKE